MNCSGRGDHQQIPTSLVREKERSDARRRDLDLSVAGNIRVRRPSWSIAANELSTKGSVAHASRPTLPNAIEEVTEHFVPVGSGKLYPAQWHTNGVADGLSVFIVLDVGARPGLVVLY